MPDLEHDAVVVGSGPNGLAAAVTLARAGLSVLVVEARDTPGGGTRTAELTLPGFRHDVCAAVHPLALVSPFFRGLGPGETGVEWIHPPASFAHPFDDGTAALALRSLEATARGLGRDGAGWRRLYRRPVERCDRLLPDLLGPLRLPRHPLLLASAAPLLLAPAATVARALLRGSRARALFAGLAAHSTLPLTRAASGAFGLLLGTLAHAVGWPIARGGSQAVSDGLVRCLSRHGGGVRCGFPVERLEDLPPSRVVLLDTSPRDLERIAGPRLPPAYRAALRRYRYGPGVFKLDWALSDPIPWRAEGVSRAGTVHLGGTLPEIAASERAPWEGRRPIRPFVLLVQPSLFDPTRAPPGRHTAWAYCHAPHGSTEDMTAAVEAQVERFAPGFRDTVLGRSARGARDLEGYNRNCVGGAITGGVQDVFQLFTRPTRGLTPYRTPARGIYLCSSSTPPGGGVHGMCGHHAARTVLADLARGRA